MEKQFTIQSIGSVLNEKGNFGIRLTPEARSGLKQLDQFSHVLVFWWADGCDNNRDRKKVLTPLPYAGNEEAGVFACRSEYRPNPIAVTVCPILKVDENKGILDVAFIDAENETPVLDLKPYIPVCDRIKKVKVARWFNEWPDWYEEAESFFSQYNFES